MVTRVAVGMVMALVWAGLGFAESVSEPERVRISWEVEAPEGTRDEAIHLGGNLPELGSWRPDGIRLVRGKTGIYRGEAEVPKGARLEFKFTRGTWGTVERRADGGFVPNRVHEADGPGTVRARVEAWTTEERPARRSTRTGTIREHRGFPSEHLAGTRRDVWVYLPPGYDDPARADERYPTLYLQDGRNVFDAATAAFGVEWGVDETAERLLGEGATRRCVIVAVDHSPNRAGEYTIIRDEARNVGGEGAAYLDFLVEELKPFIDANYRTAPERESTAIGGSSLGGLIALDALAERGGTFGAGWVFSPSLWWADEAILKRWESDEPTPEGFRGARVFLGTGDREGSRPEEHAARMKRLAEALRRRGIAVESRVQAEGGHNEATWGALADPALRWLYPASE